MATEFEATSGRVVALMEAGDASDLATKLPVEAARLQDYASLTSIRTSATRVCGMGGAEPDDELQGLISEMISG
ncbi:hypothetical protein QQZ08_002690 [Neonectria magnoliae]|uniref:Uncharacterized protein n=1 Tax=Neonectria magnoliae TaxID=2732573 RepID=A0ABR1IAL7_9HYPO